MGGRNSSYNLLTHQRVDSTIGRHLGTNDATEHRKEAGKKR
jgi:hypothetical protein